MRLLSKKEATGSRNRDLDVEAAKVNELKGQVIALTKTLNILHAEYEEKKAATIAATRSLDSEYALRLDGLRGEVAGLESRRREALEPLTEKRAQLQAYEEKLKTDDLALTSREKAIEEGLAFLAENKAAVIDSQDRLHEEESRINRLATGAAHQASVVSASNEALNARLTAFSARAAAQDAKAVAQAAAVAEAQALITADKAFLAAEREAIRVDRLHLESQQASLRTAFEVARKKGIL